MLKIEKIEEILPRIFRKLVFTVTEHMIQHSFPQFYEYVILLEKVFEVLKQYNLEISDV